MSSFTDFFHRMAADIFNDARTVLGKPRPARHKTITAHGAKCVNCKITDPARARPQAAWRHPWWTAPHDSPHEPDFLRETHELVLEDTLKRRDPEDILKRYAPEERLKGLDPATIEAWLAKQRRDH